MNVVVEDAGTCRKKLSVEWPAERVQSEYDSMLAEFCKMAKIKGFRPGKAPVKVVEKRYAKDILEEVRERLVPAGYQQAVKERNLQVVQVLDLEDVTLEIGKPMTFTVSIEVAPEFDLPKYKGIPLERKKETVADEKVDETILSIREQFASFDEVEGRPVQKGDLVQIDYEGVCDGQPIEDMGEATKGLGARKDFWVRADENAFLPEFADGLAGMNIGEKKQIFVEFDAEFSVQELAGKKATYFVDVKGVREKKLPGVDEAFLKRIGVEDEETLRARIREDLERAAKQRETGQLRNALIEHLLKSVDMEVPPSAVSRETQQIIQDIVRENTSRGAKQEQLIEKKEEIMDVAARNAMDRVKAQFLLDRIAEEEGIEVNPQQLREHVDRMAGGYGMTPDALRAELKKKDAMDNVKEELRRNLTVDFLLEQAAIKE